MTETTLRGRFAPSPTGPLHFGSLVAAVGSYLNIKSRGGEWLVRVEDLDPPREQPGATDQILRALEAYGLHWDRQVEYQGRRSQLYEQALAELDRDGLLYHCRCSRKDVELAGLPGLEGYRYPGTCRSLQLAPGDSSLRIITPDEPLYVHDLLQGELQQNLQQELGDFILRRRDGLYSYQLAVVVDDADQGITEVCRGTDLIDSTPRQVYLQQALNLPTPEYLHLPIAVNALNQKLSKQTHAPPVPVPADSRLLASALTFLGQPIPEALVDALPVEQLDWGTHHWDLERVPRERQISIHE